MVPKRVSITEAFAGLPDEWGEDILPLIQSRLKESGQKVVVLDDDPTGAQTTYDVPVLTDWSVAMIEEELRNDLPVCFILTNTRALPAVEARELTALVAGNVSQAARNVGKDVAIISRSDSTLRGHFPIETEAIAEAFEEEFVAWILVPFFLEGGRYTIGDVQYVAEGDDLVPAGETEFARDSAFAFTESRLKHWVEEKTGGRVSASDVASISLEDIRTGGPTRVAAEAMAWPRGTIAFANAVSMRDAEVVALGLMQAERQGRRFLHRTAASFVRARAGISARSLLSVEELELGSSGAGLIVVGSYVPRTTSQLEELIRVPNVEAIEVDVSRLLSEERRASEVDRVATKADAGMKSGKDVVVFTTRRLILGDDVDGHLAIGRTITAGLIEIVRSLSERPRYLLSKGGNTSSGIAAQALGVKRAMVPGQILPGVPVWKLGSESRWPGLAFVLFPGNVGGPDAVSELVLKLRNG